jgi:hypothetical protein
MPDDGTTLAQARAELARHRPAHWWWRLPGVKVQCKAEGCGQEFRCAGARGAAIQVAQRQTSGFKDFGDA